jgi:aspartate/methionine/tyrosine aminotransferase
MSSIVSRFSQRLPPHAERNAISRAVDDLRAEGVPLVDLTASNPTAAGIPYPEELLAPLADLRGLRYEPHPFGLFKAREAVAEDAARRGVRLEPEQVVLTASTSESYGWLFKLLCDPGAAVLTPQPSYPLFEHLTRLEAVSAVPYALDYHGRWEIDFDALAAAPGHVRAVMVVTPNNPTGSYVSGPEVERLGALCRTRGWALIADEVFADYPLDDTNPVTDLAQRAGVLTFSLGGASKTLGLPQVKLGWIVVGGPSQDRDRALAALELIADTYLSVGTPVQLAAPDLLTSGATVRHAIQTRVVSNLARARSIARSHPACEILHTGGGWSAVVRVPATRSEEALTLELLARERVLVHPGFFFDFAREAFIVVSLLPRTDIFADAFERALRLASA